MAKARINEEKLEKDLEQGDKQPGKKMIMDIVTVASKNRMTIPTSVRNELKLERGDSIIFLRCEKPTSFPHIGILKIREEYLFEDIKVENKK
jgi:AbrB family looped-hinge helix DNA binding protein